jgi:NAD+ kinase
MIAAIYGKQYQPAFSDSLRFFFDELKNMDCQIHIHHDFYELIKRNENFDPQPDKIFKTHEDISSDTDIFFSIGGDGTFLESVSYVRDSKIPMVGINSGRMGFLANISKDDLPTAMKNIFKKNYTIEHRTLLKLQCRSQVFREWKYALNEITVQKRDSGSMIVIHLYADNELLNSYWSDGLIISTPTGSTAYSLSVGGPIVTPGSSNFIITPIAPHTLTVRPLVVPDSVRLRIQIEARHDNYLASLDYHSEILDTSVELFIKKANFKINMLKFENTSYFETLRTKLMWGLDKRN